jgi:hypothetical protein
VTGEAGAERLRVRARERGQKIDSMLVVAPSAADPGMIDLALVPELLRARLDVRLAQHDGGATALEAFVDARAICQLNLTLMRSRSVRDVLETTSRLDEATRKRALESWSTPARLFPRGGGSLPWPVVYAVAEEGENAEAAPVTFDVRAPG